MALLPFRPVHLKCFVCRVWNRYKTCVLFVVVYFIVDRPTDLWLLNRSHCCPRARRWFGFNRGTSGDDSRVCYDNDRLNAGVSQIKLMIINRHIQTCDCQNLDDRRKIPRTRCERARSQWMLNSNVVPHSHGSELTYIMPHCWTTVFNAVTRSQPQCWLGRSTNTHIVLDLRSLIYRFGESCTIVHGITSQPANVFSNVL